MKLFFRMICCVWLPLAACTVTPLPKPTPAPVRIRIISDFASAQLTQALADAYSAQSPHVTFGIEWQNTRGAHDALFAGRTDFIIVSQLLPLPEGRPVPWSGELAQDAVAVIVNRTNPLQNLSYYELREMLAGARSRWSDVGFPQLGDVDLAVRDSGEIDRLTVDAVVMGSVKTSLNAVVLPNVDTMQNFVGSRASSIGYMPLSRMKAGGLVKAVSLEGLPAAPDSIASGGYKLIYNHYVLAPFEPQWEARNFALWMLTAQGQAVVQRAGLVTTALR